ncbi:MAG TPA: helix-turn-helix domain-containing protein, partial [Chloroflexia bacterium]|nr:helix-turn-helix domain-containing protein [Chloroflexia bacterium]
MPTTVRDLTAEERTQLERLAHSRTAPLRDVERARMILASSHGLRVAAIARDLQLDPDRITCWIRRFNASGLPGLQDRPRPGRPATYTPQQVSQIMAAALAKPTDLGLAFGSWTLDRLVVYVREHHHIGIQRSRLDELLLREGLRWRAEESWFGQRVDPDFAQKRGPLKRSTRRPRR